MSQKSQTIIVESNVAYMVLYFFALIGITFVVLTVTGASILNTLMTMAVVGTYYIFSLVTARRTLAVEVRKLEGIVRIKYSKLLQAREESYKTGDLTCSFQVEVRARGLKARVFRIKNGSATVMGELPNKSGWSESKLNLILETLKA